MYNNQANYQLKFEPWLFWDEYVPGIRLYRFKMRAQVQKT